jgi:hypothetical protein
MSSLRDDPAMSVARRLDALGIDLSAACLYAGTGLT